MDTAFWAIDEKVKNQKKELEELAEKTKQDILGLNELIPNSLFSIIEKGIIVQQSALFGTRGGSNIRIQASHDGYSVLEVTLPKGLWRLVALFEPIDKSIPIKESDLPYYMSRDTLIESGYKIIKKEGK